MIELSGTARLVIGGLTIAGAAAGVALIKRNHDRMAADPTADITSPAASGLNQSIDTSSMPYPRVKGGITAEGLTEFHVRVRGNISSDKTITRLGAALGDPIVNDVRQPISKTSIESFVNGRTR